MARIDKRRAKGSRPNAQRVTSAPRRGGTSAAVEDTLFFPWLRRHTKWVFLALALFFGLGFVLFGVGAGGTGLGDIFRNRHDGGGGPSVSSALKATQQRPKDPQAWNDLANIYRTKGDTADAIRAQTRVTTLTPKDADSYRTLAGDYFTQAHEKALEAQNAQTTAQYSGSVSPAASGPTKSGKPLFSYPLSTVAPAGASDTYSAAIQAESTALQNAIAAYQKVAALTPNDPNVQQELGTNALTALQQSGDSTFATVAVNAYRRYLKLAPDSSDAPLIRRQLKQLTKQTPSS
jgi:tetratricopeptide (TPR) repeat protein